MRRTQSADVRQLDEQTCMCAQMSDAENRKWLGQESQRTRSLEETVTIFQALSGQRMIVGSEQHEEDSLANERWLRSCCGADEPAMLVNSGVLGSDQGVDGEEYRDVAVQLQDGSWQIHQQGPQGRNVVHVCAHRKELSSDRDAGELGQLRDTIWLHQTC